MTAASIGVLWLIAALALSPIFVGSGWRIPLLLAAMIPLIITWVVSKTCDRWTQRGRRLRFGSAFAFYFCLAIAGLWGLLGWIAFPDTTLAGIPTFSTLSRAFAALSQASDRLSSTVPPVASGSPFLVLAMTAIWFCASISGSLLWGRRAPLAAAAIPITMFVVINLFAEGDTSTYSTGLLIVAAGLLVVWADRRKLHQPSRQSFIASGVVIATIIVAVVVSPSLPGADQPALLPLTNTEGIQVDQNPSIDLRTRIESLGDRTLFEVSASAPAYWRLTALDQFDGNIWRTSPSKPASEDVKELPNGTSSSAQPGAEQRADAIHQEIHIRNLVSPWLPVAAVPVVRPHTTKIDHATDSILVDGKTTLNTTYEAISTPTNASPDALNAATFKSYAPLAQAIKPFVQLPDLPAGVTAWSKQATADATTPFQMANNIETNLRKFRYSLTSKQAHGKSELEQFLLDSRTGYCAQFASAMAVAARVNGIPSRVVVGFATGKEVAPLTSKLPSAPQQGSRRWTVRGKDAHAWPELYFPDIGWVGFEPTPRSGLSPSSLTRQPGEVASTQQSQPPAPPPVAEAGGESGAAESPVSASPPDTNEKANHSEKAYATNRSNGQPASDGTGVNWNSGLTLLAWTLTTVTIVLTILLATLLLAIVCYKSWRRRRLRTKGARGAWQEGLNFSRDCGVATSSTLTPLEQAEAAQQSHVQLVTLAQAVSENLYGRPTLASESTSKTSWSALSTARTSYYAVSKRNRLRDLFSIRSLQGRKESVTQHPTKPN